MFIRLIRSDKIYQQLLDMPEEEKRPFFRENVLLPFKPKFDIQHIPLEADDFDVFDILAMTNILPEQINKHVEKEITAISSEDLWKTCQESLESVFQLFKSKNISIPKKEYVFTIFLGNPESKALMVNDGCSGEGGIPGYMSVTIVPTEKNIKQLPAVIAHECNHNIRFQHIQWTPQVTLAEWIIAEGLAENFVEYLYGKDAIGPWVTKTSLDTLDEVIKPMLKDKMNLSGMQQVMPYVYGDEITKLQGGEPVGLPHAAGYALGYHLVKFYLNKTQTSVVDATILSPEVILKEVSAFWN